MKRLTTCLAQAAVAIAAAACAPSPPTENPIPSIAFSESSSGRDTLVVMRPGRGDRAETFTREGFESALYSAEHPDKVDGVILLAPYLGSKEVSDEIKAAGGIQAWQPDTSNLEPHEIRLWSWLQDVSEGKIATPVIFGYGTSDRMAPNYDTLVTKLAPSRVYTVEGGHNWDAWRALWARIAQEQLR